MTTDTLGVGYEMTLERRFEAPRALVFDCLTKAEHLARWWGPRMFDVPRCESDARPGGAILIDMRGPEPFGINEVRGEYLEVSPPERLKFVLRAFQGADGSWGIEHVTTMNFEETGDGATLMRMSTLVLQASDELLPALGGMKEGWSQSFDKMAELLFELR
jgi:uncharacterized protein YndB with AHSA1/START domain